MFSVKFTSYSSMTLPDDVNRLDFFTKISMKPSRTWTIHCRVFNKSYPDLLFSLPPTLSQLQTPSTIAVWLSVWLSASDCLSIDFLLDKRLWISWFLRLHLFGRCRNLEITIMMGRQDGDEETWGVRTYPHSFILETYIAPLQDTTTQRRS